MALAFLAIATILVLSPEPIVAQTPESPPTPLTDKLVRGFSEAILDLARWSHENSERWEEMSERWSDGDGELSQERIDDYMSTLSAYLGESSEVAREATRIVERHGFTSLDHWSDVASRVMHTYSVVKIAETDMSASLESIASAALTPEQRKQMEQAIAEVNTRMGEFADSVPETDKRVVERNIELIESSLKAASEVGETEKN